jgi:hypothetical protein
MMGVADVGFPAPVGVARIPSAAVAIRRIGVAAGRDWRDPRLKLISDC